MLIFPLKNSFPQPLSDIKEFTAFEECLAWTKGYVEQIYEKYITASISFKKAEIPQLCRTHLEELVIIDKTNLFDSNTPLQKVFELCNVITVARKKYEYSNNIIFVRYLYAM